MGQLEKDVAVILTHVEYLRKAQEKAEAEAAEAEKAHEALAVRVTDLEQAAKRDRWLVGGAAAVLAFLFNNSDKILKVLKFFVGLVFLVVLSGCAAAPLHGDPDARCNPASRWGKAPRVAIHPDMPEGARAAVDLALAYWRKQGKPLEVVSLPAEWLGFEEWVYPGMIAVVYAAPNRAPGAAGSTKKAHWGEVEGPLKYAHVEISETDWMVAAHELGHALGFGSCYGDPLGHPLDPDNLMFPYAVGGETLTTEQRLWVR